MSSCWERGGCGGGGGLVYYDDNAELYAAERGEGHAEVGGKGGRGGGVVSERRGASRECRLMRTDGRGTSGGKWWAE